MRLPKQKDIFLVIFMLLSLSLLILPLTVSMSEGLTRLIEHTTFYRPVQEFIVPYMSSLVTGILHRLPGLDVSQYPYGVVINGVDVRITWNCLGWQSFLLLIFTFVVGLKGDYTFGSKMQALFLGVLGTFLINILRMAFTAALVGWWRGLFMILFHDYFATFVFILWLFFFWWFAYKFILEDTNYDMFNLPQRKSIESQPTELQ